MPEEGGCCCFRQSEANEDGDENAEWKQCVVREHTWAKCIWMTFGLSLCIFVDILQHSMPLAFLPSVLEDRGHAPMTIATAIGVYYWTGFAGCFMITCYHAFHVLKTPEDTMHDGSPRTDLDIAADHPPTVGDSRRQVMYLIICLGVGAATLTGQALHPHCWVHTSCRFIQGFMGSFIFVYAFLLCACLFKDRQRDLAMTMASTALNVAEVMGSSIGAYIFDRWGQEAVFFFMVIMSVANQLILIGVLSSLRGDGVIVQKVKQNPYNSGGSNISETYADSPSIIKSLARKQRDCTGRFRFTAKGKRKLAEVMVSKRLLCAVILIFTAAVVKGSVEEVLPFHADHRWKMSPLEIGNLFALVAVSYLSASWISGLLWNAFKNKRVLFSAIWLAILGLTAYSMFLVSNMYHHVRALYAGVLAYGVCLGLTHTPATLILGDAVEKERGRSKDIANGVFQTMWEAGGSLGFLFGGLLAEDYGRQLRLFGCYSFFCAISAGLMLWMGGWNDEHIKSKTKSPYVSYGSTS